MRQSDFFSSRKHVRSFVYLVGQDAWDFYLVFPENPFNTLTSQSISALTHCKPFLIISRTGNCHKNSTSMNRKYSWQLEYVIKTAYNTH